MKSSLRAGSYGLTLAGANKAAPARREAACLAVSFLVGLDAAAVFLVTVFFAVAFLATVFFATFLTAVFLTAVFLVAVFFAVAPDFY